MFAGACRSRTHGVMRTYSSARGRRPDTGRRSAKGTRARGRKRGSEFCGGRADRKARCRGMIIVAVPGGTNVLRCNLRAILESKGASREMPRRVRPWLVTDDDCATSRYNGMRRAALHCTVARLPAHGLAAAVPLATARVSVPATTPIPWEDD